MPFIEVFDFQATREQRRMASEEMTQALCEAYEIASDIISVYFFDIGDEAYAHAGNFPADKSDRRLFVKLHAFRRDVAMRCDAARLVTAAAARAYRADPAALAVYFLDRDPSEVAHGGILASNH